MQKPVAAIAIIISSDYMPYFAHSFVNEKVDARDIIGEGTQYI
jgi:hypothetical protein